MNLNPLKNGVDIKAINHGSCLSLSSGSVDVMMSSSHTDDSLTFHCLKQKYGASGGNMKTFIDYELEGVF